MLCTAVNHRLKSVHFLVGDISSQPSVKLTLKSTMNDHQSYSHIHQHELQRYQLDRYMFIGGAVAADVDCI